tara:strand:+ start:1224 stop:3209 length:1986 start_codon:yes stop_codon:yes gene_type:complete
MANFPSSPGVSLNEIDNTFISPTPVAVGAAIIGPTWKGPVEIPTIVTSYTDFVNRFGDSFESGSDTYSFLTSISAYNYFVEGGESLLVARVVSGSYTTATSTVHAIDESGVISTDTDALLTSLAGVTGSAGTYTISGSGGTGASFTASITLTSGTAVSTITATNGGSGYSVGDVITIPSGSLGFLGGTAVGTNATITLDANDIVNDTTLTLETLSEGAIMNSSGTHNSDGTLTNGTLDNIRFEVASSNTNQGTFNLIIRQGDDKSNDKTILETFNGVNLDPNSPRYISKVVGDQVVAYDATLNQTVISSGDYANNSRYVRIKSISKPTLNYFDSTGTAKTAFTGSIPTNQSGSFGGAVGTIKGGANFYKDIAAQTQGLVSANYTNMVNLLANTNDYKFNVLSTPGLLNEHHASTISSIINNTIKRGDNIYILDTVAYNGTLNDAIAQATTRNTSYASTYWPWTQIQDPATGKNVFVPASTLIPGVYAHTDRVSNSWNAPAGISRGGLSTVLRAKIKLSEANKTALYDQNINPIATFPRKGVVVFGQKTLQKETTALDRINVRRSLLELKEFIGQVADNLVFENNTATTRNKFLSEVNPYLEIIQQKGGLFAFKVIMDDTNNTDDVIDRNQLVGQIYIQPSRTAEFVSLDFTLLPTGAEFPA